MLWAKTQLYHQTVYQSNVPEEFLDAMTSQSVILRGPTCFWSEDGYFGGFEGSYGCCPLNCTHVWNYAQTHARLFPDVGRNMRVSDFITYLRESGETSHRQHSPHGAFTDGHCACIEGAYREYQLSPDTAFLTQVWPGVKKAVDWLIEAIDKTHEGHADRAPAEHVRLRRVGSQHVHRLAVPVRAGGGRADGGGDERCGQRRPLARGPRGGDEEPEREAVERRVLHSDPRAAQGERLQQRLPLGPVARPVVGAHAGAGISVPGRADSRGVGSGDAAQFPREVRRASLSGRAATFPTTRAGC